MLGYPKNAETDPSISASFSPLLVIQNGQLSVNKDNMYTSSGYLLRALSLPRETVSSITDWLDMSITVLTGP